MDRLPPGARADRVTLDKSSRTLTLWEEGAPLKDYRVSLGFSPKGPKKRQGDGKTPEGKYILDYRNPNSRYHLAIHVSYPVEGDRIRARGAGVDPGGDIMIHGFPNRLHWLGPLQKIHVLNGRWTAGCIALTDVEMEEIWRAVPDGTAIEIRP